MLAKSGNWVEMRWYSEEDLPAMVGIHRQSFRREKWSKERFRKFAERDGHVLKVAVCEGEVIGTLLYAVRGGMLDIRRLAVREDKHRDGVGKLMLQSIVSGTSLFRVRVRESNITGQLFFAGLGFKAVEPFIQSGVFGDGEDAFLMMQEKKSVRIRAASTVG